MSLIPYTFFWLSLSLLFYTYIGFAVITWLLIRLRRPKPPVPSFREEDLPAVAFIVCAFNEADIIGEKIDNTLATDYPRDRFRVLVVSDGSTDDTHLLASQKQVLALHEPARKGKVAAMNRAAALVDEPILIFSDANTFLQPNAVRLLVQHFADPKTGAVAGEKKIAEFKKGKAVSAGEGIYWKYESLLKRLDATLYSVVGAAGELIAIRKNLYQPTEEDTIIEDFVLSLRVCLKGYRVAYEPGAYALETGSESMKDEQKRKVRIAAGGFQAMSRLKALFSFQQPLLSFSYISHRVFRWAVGPLCLPLLFISNAWIVWGLEHSSVFYTSVFWLQALFYLLALAGWLMAELKIRNKLLFIPYYFLFMNTSVYRGFLQYRSGKQTVLWEKAKRMKSAS